MLRPLKCRPPVRARYVRLELEELEQRAVPAALTPVQVRHAYGFDQIAFNYNGKTIVGDGAGQTIAIVNAFNHSRIASDLDTFDKAFSINGKQTLYQQYGAASSFLTVVNPQGTPLADPTGGLWNLESALDVQWAHAMAPAAKILLVQARTGSMLDLLGAVDYARKQPGVVAVSMSWGAGEFYGETYYDSYFVTPTGHLGGSSGQGGAKLPGGVTFVAAAGDDGAPGLWPAMSRNVVAVGGTTLTVDTAGNYKGEIGWTESGGGISKYETKPSYQNGTVSGTMRGTPDVAYNGDPKTGVYVYDSMPLNGKTGWWQVGGTSAGTPQWAALVAIADQGRALQGKGSLDGATQTLPALYAMASTNFHDVSKGNNGFSATVGYDYVTGRGSPIAPRVVADLLRADAKGKLTTAATPARTTSGKPATIKPSLHFAGIEVSDSRSAAVSRLHGIEFIAGMVWDYPAPRNHRTAGHAMPLVPPARTMMPTATLRMLDGLFENGIEWLGMEQAAESRLEAEAVAPAVPDEDTGARDGFFAECEG